MVAIVAVIMAIVKTYSSPKPVLLEEDDVALDLDGVFFVTATVWLFLMSLFSSGIGEAAMIGCGGDFFSRRAIRESKL